ncbi:MAG TPA: hypothetical protein VGE55_06550 [Limnobacter sp.]|uniref:hypothetical protein n=1 Tax=Limnobacter sp. TaxID=2003368 RepID=UPI002ED9909A
MQPIFSALTNESKDRAPLEVMDLPYASYPEELTLALSCTSLSRLEAKCLCGEKVHLVKRLEKESGGVKNEMWSQDGVCSACDRAVLFEHRIVTGKDFMPGRSVRIKNLRGGPDLFDAFFETAQKYRTDEERDNIFVLFRARG